jgi:tRNA pseudouridine38-40 synthase
MPHHQNFKITLSYDGTNYCGWQVQPNGDSIQETVQNALKKILREEIKLLGSGRTDAGVHAFAQTANFSTDKKFEINKLIHSLNSIIPLDIRIKEIQKVPNEFHARYSANSKTYHYFIHLNKIIDPFMRLYRYHCPYSLDLSLLEKATESFLGEHDFTSFANEPSKGSAKNNPIKTLMKLDMKTESNGIRLEFTANGFLYKMVRNITGTLIDISRKKIPISSINYIFQKKDRRYAGTAAQPQGLFLFKVHYNEEIPSKEEK